MQVLPSVDWITMPLRLPARPWAPGRPSTARKRTAVLAATTAVLAASVNGCAPMSLQEPMVSATQLKQELLTPPPGATPYTGGTLAPGGILSLDQFVDGHFPASEQVSEKSSLTQDGYVHAVENNWDSKDESVDLFLLQFQTTPGAQDFVSNISEGTSQQNLPIEPLTALSGVSGGEAWAAGSIDDKGDTPQIAWFSVGNVAVDLHYFSPSSNTAVVDQLAKAQLARLEGHVTKPSPLPAVTGQPPAPTQGPNAATATQADKNRLLQALTTPPSGSHPWPVNSDDGASGIIDLQQVADRLADDVPGFTARQRDRGFQYAVRENWDAPDGTEADVMLLQFSSAVGAQSFALDYQAGDGNVVGTSGTYTVPSSGNGQAFEHPKLTSDGNSWTTGYALAGNVAVAISFWRPAKPDREAVVALMQQQYRALMADPSVSSAADEAPPLPTPGS
jgi:hypothetical protein